MPSDTEAIRCENLSKRFGKVVALDNLSLTIERGAVFGFLGLAVSIFGAVAIGGAAVYLLTLFLFADGGLGRFALGLVVSSTYLLFIGSLTLFWSAMFARHLLAGGIAFSLMIVQGILSAIPHTGRYWPVASVDWSASIIRGEAGDEWAGFAIACGLIVLLSIAAWGVFRRKEL